VEQQKQGDATREFIRVLRLLEDHPMASLKQAVQKALQIGAHSREAVAQFLIPAPPWRPPTFLLDGRPHLRQVTVSKPDISAYQILLSKGKQP
jgi:hypothetical protein